MNKRKLKKVDYVELISPSIKDARMRRSHENSYFAFNLDSKYLNLGAGKKYFLKTYGCQGNLSDSEKIAGILEALGYEECSKDSEADLIIFNTCAIRENAEERVFGEIGRCAKLKQNKPELMLAVCGCMPQEEATIRKIKETYFFVNIVFGTHNITDLPALLYDAINENKYLISVESIEGVLFEDVPLKRASTHKAWVDIMYGCDEFCTYCIVPYTRGKERSRKPEDILKEVQELIDAGYQEICLLGQNVNAYGKDLGDGSYSFGDLLADLNKMPIPRIRYTTSHPRDLDDKTIDAMALGGNIMPHLHLPVQSGSNRILKAMNRKYTKEEYLEKVNKLKEKVPGISITTDIIVAFPGEEEEDFEATLELVREVGFEGAYTFIYSPREGTPAAKLPNPLTEEEKHQRLLKLNDLINEGFLKGRKRFEGMVVPVLIDGVSKNNKNMLCGYTPHEMLVNLKADPSLIGKIVNVKLIKAYSWHFLGELVE